MCAFLLAALQLPFSPADLRAEEAGKPEAPVSEPEVEAEDLPVVRRLELLQLLELLQDMELLQENGAGSNSEDTQ